MPLLHAVRSLRKSPAFTITAILTLALGLGAIGTAFTVLYSVLLAPLPYGQPERLVSVGLRSDTLASIKQPPGLFRSYRESMRSFEAIGYYRHGTSNLLVEGSGRSADNLGAAWVSASLVPMLQVPPLLGRSFNADEERRGGPEAVLLSEAEWRQRFNADPKVLGRVVMVNNVPRQVVGVMPARFAFPDSNTRLWLPAKLKEGVGLSDFAYVGVARLGPDATIDQAQREIERALSQVAQDYPRLESGKATSDWLAELQPRPALRPLRDEVVGNVGDTLWLLTAAAAVVLLTAWANFGNLMLIRADARQGEWAVREALGASRAHLATRLLGESLLLGALAGCFSLAITALAVAALRRLGPADLPRIAELQVGLATLSLVFSTVLVGSVLCALLPMLRIRRSVLTAKLDEATRGHSSGKARQRLREGITTLQIALALTVACGSALLLRTAYQLRQVDPGFSADQVTTAWTLLPFARYGDDSSIAFQTALLERVKALPAVQAAGFSSHLPLSGAMLGEYAVTTPSASRPQRLPLKVVDAGYFEVLRIPLLAGQTFRPLATAPNHQIILSRRAAQRLLPDAHGGEAIGQQVSLVSGGPRYVVVGIAGDVREHNLADEPPALVYWPQSVPNAPGVEPGVQHAMALVVRSTAPPDQLIAAIRRIAYELDPGVPLYNVESMGGVMRASTARLSLLLSLLTVAAVISLLLGAIGLYGVMSYAVALRTREFGVRLALGASPNRIARLVTRRGLTLTALGAALGFALYGAASSWLSSVLYGVSVSDPATLSAVTAVLFATAALACWLPAARAAMTNPMQALRTE